eukprot:SAG31_NODE_2536_length_5550_cov_2.962759_5_plen_54_part_00
MDTVVTHIPKFKFSREATEYEESEDRAKFNWYFEVLFFVIEKIASHAKFSTSR